MNEIVIVNCPSCQKSVEWITENSFRPFCSKRCKLIDLGEWASENHRIPVNEADEDEQWSEAQSL